MTDLFISYSRKDQQFVRTLHGMLEQNGRDVWVDWENIPLTAEWLQEIYDGIEAANAFMYVISPDSVRSEVCSLELAHALAYNKRLIPILRRELVEDADKYALDSHVSSHNWIFFREQDDFDKSFQALTDALDTDLDYLRVHTRLLVRSMEWNDKERDASLVLRGRDLTEAIQWLDKSADKEPQPTDLHRDYIAASQRASAARRRVVVLTAIYGLVVFMLAVFAFWQAVTAENRRQEAEEQKEIAQDNAATATIAQGEAQIQAATAIAAQATAIYNGEQARSLALSSYSREVLYRDGNSPLAIALALAASDTDEPSYLIEGALAQAVYFPGTRYIIEETATSFTRLAAHGPTAQAVFVSASNELVLWDLNAREARHRWLDYPDANISAVAFSNDGQWIAAGYANGIVVLYDAKTYDKKLEITSEGFDFTRLAFIPENHYLAASVCMDVGCDTGQVEIYDVQTGDITQTFTQHTAAVYALAVSPDGQQVLSGDDAGFVYVWSVETGEELGNFNFEAGQVTAAVYMPHGQQALIAYGVAGGDFSLRLVDFTDFAALQQIYQLRGHTNFIWDLAVTPSGRQAISGSYDNSMILWNLETGDVLQRFRGHGNLIYGVALAGQRRVLSGSLDGTIRYWDIANGAEISRFETHTGIIQAQVLFETAQGEARLVSAARDGVLILWDLETGQEIRRFESDAGAVWGVDVHVENGLLISAHRVSATNGRVVLWDLETGQELRRFDNGTGFLSVSFNSDASVAALAGEPGSAGANIVLWDTATGEVIKELVGHNRRIWSAKFSPDNQFIASVDVDSHVWLWRVDTGEIAHDLVGHEGVIYSVAYSPDGASVLSGSGDGTLRLWNTTTGELVRTFSGHQDEIKSVAFDPTGQIALSGSDDGSVRLWDLETGAEIQRFDGHLGEVWSVAYHPDGQSVFSGSTDTTVRRWQVFSMDELLTWTYENRYIPTLSEAQCALYQIEDWCRKVNNP